LKGMHGMLGGNNGWHRPWIAGWIR
jgi:hypothetical protein